MSVTTKQVDIFTANWTWTCPAWVTSAIVEARWAWWWSATNGWGWWWAYSKSTVSVTPTTWYSVVVWTSASNSAWWDSTFDTTTVVAKWWLAWWTWTWWQAAAGTGSTKFSWWNWSVWSGWRWGWWGAGDTWAWWNWDSSTWWAWGTTNWWEWWYGNSYWLGAYLWWWAGTDTTLFAWSRWEVRITYDLVLADWYPYVVDRTFWRDVWASPTSHTIAFPAGIAAWDLVLCCFACDSNPTVSASWWTSINTATNGTTVRTSILGAVYSGWLTTTITTSTNQPWAWVVIAIRNRAWTIWALSSSTANASTANADPWSVNTWSTKGICIAAVWFDLDLASMTSVSALSSWYSWLWIETYEAGWWVYLQTEEKIVDWSSSTENPWAMTNTATPYGAVAVYIQWASSSAIKTIDWLAKASVKTVDWLAIASVKTWNWLA